MKQSYPLLRQVNNSPTISQVYTSLLDRHFMVVWVAKHSTCYNIFTVPITTARAKMAETGVAHKVISAILRLSKLSSAIIVLGILSRFCYLIAAHTPSPGLTSAIFAGPAKSSAFQAITTSIRLTKHKDNDSLLTSPAQDLNCEVRHSTTGVEFVCPDMRDAPHKRKFVSPFESDDAVRD